MSDDKSEMYKTGGGNFCPKTTMVDEKVVALLTPQFKPLTNEFDSSAPYYTLDNTQEQNEVALASQDMLLIMDDKEILMPEVQSVPPSQSVKRSLSPLLKDVDTPKNKKRICLTETKNNNINNVSNSLIKRKNQKQINEDAITNKKLEILEIQRQQELMKLEKTKILFDVDIELKQILLETAKMDLEFKRRNFQL